MKTYDVIDVPANDPCENCTPCMRLKLMEMGCLPGEKVSIERRAPLGDPIAISISGYLLSVRKDEADTIMVQQER